MSSTQYHLSILDANASWRHVPHSNAVFQAPRALSLACLQAGQAKIIRQIDITPDIKFKDNVSQRVEVGPPPLNAGH